METTRKTLAETGDEIRQSVWNPNSRSSGTGTGDGTGNVKERMVDRADRQQKDSEKACEEPWPKDGMDGR